MSTKTPYFRKILSKLSSIIMEKVYHFEQKYLGEPKTKK